MEIIRTENLSKIYNPKSDVPIKALNSVNLSVCEGETLAIMGPSGCGKSTLLHILGCLDEPSEGRYFLEGNEVCFENNKKTAKLRNEKLGFVLQNYGLIGERSVYDNIIIPLIFAGATISKEEKRLDTLMDKLGILHLKKKKCNDLSGGEKQRTAIARALANNPKVLLADEPTGALDEATGKNIMALFMQINREQGTTIIIVTHDPNIAAYCSRTIHMKDGKTVE